MLEGVVSQSGVCQFNFLKALGELQLREGLLDDVTTPTTFLFCYYGRHEKLKESTLKRDSPLNEKRPFRQIYCRTLINSQGSVGEKLPSNYLSALKDAHRPITHRRALSPSQWLILCLSCAHTSRIILSRSLDALHRHNKNVSMLNINDFYGLHIYGVINGKFWFY